MTDDEKYQTANPKAVSRLFDKLLDVICTDHDAEVIDAFEALVAAITYVASWGGDPEIIIKQLAERAPRLAESALKEKARREAADRETPFDQAMTKH